MILSISPNPCVDCTIELKSLNVGKLNRIDNKIMTYSGKALNVAIGVSRLGGQSLATGFLFQDNGTMFEHRLNEEGVRTNFVWNEGCTRINYKIVDEKSMMTEINDKGDNVVKSKQLELLQKVQELSGKANIVVMSGSLPSGVDDNYYAKLCDEVPSHVKKIVDTTGYKLTNTLNKGIYLVKPNLDELMDLTGEIYQTKQEMLKGCYRLIDHGAENVLLSLGRKGAILTNGSKNYFCKSTTVAVNSTVGAGDSMISAVSIKTEQGESLKEILKCAVSAGTASITTPGTNLFYKDKYEEIYTKLKIEEI